MAKYQGSKLGDGTPLNVAVYRAYRNAGLSHTQALAVTAEVGRENGFNAGTLFGFHTDPAANDRGGSIQNIGMLSWNRNRGNALAAHLKKSGTMSNGRMAQTQANLNAQAQFSVREMKSPAYAKKLRSFWGNPNASPETYAKELGRHYIAWAYGQNTIKAQGGGRKPFDWRSHDTRRRGYLNTLSGMLGGGSYQAEPSQQGYQRPARRPISEIAGYGSNETYQRPERRPVSELQGYGEQYQRPERRPISELQGYNNEQPQEVFQRPERKPIAELEGYNPQPQEQQFQRPERLPVSELEGYQINTMQTPELERQDWLT